MKTFLTGLLLALIVHHAFAQKAPAKFGDIFVEDLKMDKYEKDPSAEAVVLVDYGESSMRYNQVEGFVLAFERLTRIKILTKDGLDWGNFEIPLYHDGGNDEKVIGLKAVTYNLENGKVVESKMKSEAVFKEKRDKNVDVLKVALPNVKEGSIVEITYKVASDFIFNFQDWEFQYTIPVVWSEYRARIPEYFNYDKYSQGYIIFDINEHTTAPQSITLTSSNRSEGNVTQTAFHNDKINFQENRFRWVSKDVPAFRSEPFITTYKDYISKINFELSYTKFPNSPIKSYMGSWADINKTYSESENFGGEVTGNGFLRKMVEEITAGNSSAEEKIASIYNYVRSSMLWDGTSRKFVSTSLRKVLDEKKGNSADINLLLASMLEKAGMNVSPVLISTRDHGFVRETVPVSSQFNYVVCLVRLNDKQLLLDATDKFLPLGSLPERCLNGRGLVVSKAGHSWINLTSPVKSKTFISADFALNAEGELKGKLQFDRTGYFAQNFRKRYFSKGEAEYVKDLYDNHSWELKKSEFQNAKELHESFKETHELQINDHTIKAGDMIYLNPFVQSIFSENPFKAEKREYPVDFGYAFDRIYAFKLMLPEGYAVEEMPSNKMFMLPENAGRYSYNAVQSGNMIQITSMLQINKSLFAQTEYPNLREFYNQLIAKQTEQIVLKKK